MVRQSTQMNIFRVFVMGLCFNHQLRPTRQPWLGTFPHWWFPRAWIGVLVKQNQVVPSFAGKASFISWYKLVKLPNYRYLRFLITIHPAVQCHFNQRLENDFANVGAPKGQHGQVMVYGSVWDEATWLVGITHGLAKWCQILENLRYYWHVDFAAPPIGWFALCTITGWWFQTFSIFHFIYGMSSFPLTNMFQDGQNHQPDYLGGP